MRFHQCAALHSCDSASLPFAPRSGEKVVRQHRMRGRGRWVAFAIAAMRTRDFIAAAAVDASAGQARLCRGSCALSCVQHFPRFTHAHDRAPTQACVLNTAKLPTRSAGRSWPHGPRQLVTTLAWLRLCAVAGQALTVAFVAGPLGMPVPAGPLLAGIVLLGTFSMFAFWRLELRWPIGEIESVAHITVDTIVLGYLLYLTGGATNPFVSLLVMPITLAATALPLRSVAFVAALAVLTYLALMRWYLPLPTQHAIGTPGGFRLHVLGMATSFGITATLLGFFIARLARALRARQADAEHERMRALRDEGILAIATQAASTAHELNTPLSTMSTLLAELARERAADPALSADIELLRGQAARCRDILRELVKVGSNQLAGAPEATTVGDFAATALDSFRLLRPEIEVRSTIDPRLAPHPIKVVPALRHALINLLNNAADASLANASSVVELALVEKQDEFEMLIRDFGKGIAGSVPTSGLRFETTKRDGLGLGLALAKATVERFGGSLAARAARDGGTEQHLRLPLPARENAPHEH